MKPLRLELIFGAKDSLSPALQHMVGGSKATTKALTATTKAIAKLQVDQKNIDSYRKLRTALDETSQEIQQQKDLIADYKRQADLAPLTSKQTKELEKAEKALDRLNEGYERNSKKLISNVQHMHQAGIKVESLAQDESNLKDKIHQTTMAYNKQKIAIDRINTAQKQYQQTQQRLQTIRGHATTGLMTAGVATAGITVPAKLSIDFESSMADVAKVVDGLRNEAGQITPAYSQMSKEIIAMSTRLPMAANDIATIVAAGGQSGIAANELTKFAESAVKMGVAFDISADEAGQAMAEMRTAFRMNQTQVTTLADQINYLGNNTPAAAKGIMDIVKRVGPLGEVSGYASGSIAALGATLRGMGVQEEVAATGIQNFMLSLVAGESATKAQRVAFQELGFESAQVAKDMQADAEGTSLKILQAVKKLPKDEQAAMLQTLFGKESIKAIAPLLNNMDALEANFIKVGDASKYAGSMEKEYAARAATTANNLQLLKNKAAALGITMGNALLPMINQGADAIGNIFARVQDWANANPVLASTLTKVVAGGILLVGGISALALGVTTLLAPLAFLKMSIATLGGGFGLFSKLAMGGISTIKMIGTVFMTVGRMMLANPILLAITAIAVAAYLIYKNWEPIKGFFVGVWNSVVSAFQTGIDWIKNIIRSVDSVFANNPILTFLFPLIGIPRIIIANWSSISAFFSTIWTAISTATSTAVSAVWSYVTDKFNGIRNFLSTCMDIIKGIVSTAWTGLCNIFLTITPLGFIVRNFDDIMAFLTGLKDRFLTLGGNIMQGLVDGIKSKFNGLKSIWNTINSYMPDFMKKKMDIHSPSRVMAGLGGHIVGGLGVGLLGAFPQLKSQYNKVLSIFDGGVHRPALDKVKQVLPSIGRVSDRPSQSQRNSSIIVEGDTITLNIHAGAGQIGQDLVQQIEQVLNRRDRDKAARIRSSYLDQD